jgi:hypothetical protein
MIASEDEGLSVLRKWFEDRTPLMCFCASSDSFGLTALAVITRLGTEDMMLAGDGLCEIRVWLQGGATFEYAEPRDFPLLAGYTGPLPLTSSLVLRFPSGIMCALFEPRGSTNG